MYIFGTNEDSNGSEKEYMKWLVSGDVLRFANGFVSVDACEATTHSSQSRNAGVIIMVHVGREAELTSLIAVRHAALTLGSGCCSSPTGSFTPCAKYRIVAER